MANLGRPLYFRVGVLVLVGLAVAVGFVLFLTSGRLGGQQLVFETYFPESVAGLDVGAPVRLRGVAVGRVTEVALAGVVYDVQGAATHETSRLVMLRFAVDPTRYGSGNVEAAVAAGLRVRIASTGVTGLGYLEADFVDPERYPPQRVPWTPRYPVIPSMPSTITQVTSAAERLMTRLDGLEIEGLLNAATGMLNDVRGQFGAQGDLANALREASGTLAALREAVRDADLAGTVREISTAARSVGEAGAAAERLLESEAISGAAASIGQAAADLRTSIARLPAVIQSLELSLRAVRGTTGDAQADLGPLLRDLRATVSSLRDTAEALRRNPSQSLFGAPPPRERR